MRRTILTLAYRIPDAIIVKGSTMKPEEHFTDYSIETDLIQREHWDRLLTEFGDATLYQTWSYGSVRWGERNLSHMIVRHHSELVAMVQVAIKRVPILGFGMAYVPWGPVWRRRGLPQNEETLLAVLHGLLQEYGGRRKLLLRLRPNIQRDITNYSIEFPMSGFELSGFVKSRIHRPYRTLILDLDPSLETIRKGFDQKWRNQLNRAERNQLTITQGTGNDLYQAFCHLQKQMQARKGYSPGVSYKEFGQIQEDLPDFQKMLVMIATHQEEPVCAVVGSAIGDTGIYLLGATGDKGLNTKASYLLQWQMIQWLKQKGCTSYDLGGIDPDNNPGVYHFKAGLSAKETQHLGTFESSSNVKTYSALLHLENFAHTTLLKTKHWGKK